MPVMALWERIGTALINGSWLVRQLAPSAGRLVVMHGHGHGQGHIDWIGRAGALKIASAPLPVMDPRDGGTTDGYIHKRTMLPDWGDRPSGPRPHRDHEQRLIKADPAGRRCIRA
jgi:hypothetical protein